LFGLSHHTVKQLYSGIPNTITSIRSSTYDKYGAVITKAMIISPAVEQTFYSSNTTTSSSSSNSVQLFPGCWPQNLNNLDPPFKGGLCFLLGFIGRLSPEKAIPLFLLAVKELVEAKSHVRLDTLLNSTKPLEQQNIHS